MPQGVRLVLFGPPGAGKGTQAQLLKQRLSVCHISSGDLFRHHVRHRTPLGLQASEYMNKGDVAMEINDVEGALEAYGTAEELYPDNIEIQYWHAIALANAKMVDRSLPKFKKIFEADENWLILTKRLPATGLLNVTDEEFQRIISQKE